MRSDTDIQYRIGQLKRGQERLKDGPESVKETDINARISELRWVRDGDLFEPDIPTTRSSVLVGFFLLIMIGIFVFWAIR